MWSRLGIDLYHLMYRLSDQFYQRVDIPKGKDQGAPTILVERLGRGILQLRLRLRHYENNYHA